jgi:CheY-specific phosphatase CheX
MTSFNAEINAKLVDVFDEVFSYLGVDHQFMCEVPESTLNTTTAFSVLVGVSGAVEGNIVFGFGKKVASVLGSKLTGMPKVQEIDIYVKSALADLYRDFCKRTLARLEVQQKEIFSSDPIYISGVNAKAIIGQTPAINLFFKASGDKFQVAYNLRKT